MSFVFVPTDANGTLLTTTRWASYKVHETGFGPGTMAYVNGTSHAGGAAAANNHHNVLDDLVTPGWLRLSCNGTTFDDIPKWIRSNLATRTPSDAAWESIQETDPFPVITSAISVAAMFRFGVTGSGAAGCNQDLLNLSSTSFAVPQYQVSTSVPAGPGALFAHGDGGGFGGVGAGQAVGSKTAPRWVSLKHDTPNDLVGVVEQDETGAYLGSSLISSVIGSPSTFTGVGDYLDANGGTLDRAWVCYSAAGTFPMDANFVLPAVTGLTISQILPDELRLSWSQVGNGGVASLDRFRVRRSVNGGGFTTLAASTANRYFVDDTGGISDADDVEYEVTALLHLSTHESAAVTEEATVDNGSVLPVTANLLAYYAANGILGAANGDSLPSWPDLSGNGLNLVQAGTVQQPTLRTNVINGLPVVRFDGSDDYMTVELTGIGAARSVFAVLLKRSAANNTYKCAMGFNSNGAILAFTNTDVAAGLLFQAPGATIGGTPTIANVLAWIFTSTSSLSIFRNGTQAPGSAFDPNDLYNVDDFVVGDNVPGNLPGDYDIAEIIIYGAALSSGDRLAVEAYLKGKYNTP